MRVRVPEEILCASSVRGLDESELEVQWSTLDIAKRLAYLAYLAYLSGYSHGH